MKRLLIYCEGQTEEMIVERLLRPHLGLHGVRVERPILAATSAAPGGQRGGFANWRAMEFDLRRLFAADTDPDLRFTTLLDVYAMPAKVLELAGFAAPVSVVAGVEAVEKALHGTFDEPRFKPYLQRHELEALLLADCAALGRVFHRHRQAILQLAADVAVFAHAEDIDHGADTHPAARLAAAIPGFRNLKASNAYFVLAEAGLDIARARCPRYHAWMKHWEDWGAAPP
jgi:hypothetical protein